MTQNGSRGLLWAAVTATSTAKTTTTTVTVETAPMKETSLQTMMVRWSTMVLTRWETRSFLP
ncbi:hypothetical protein WT05_03415 [Burkholderia stagnalis]|nr:hypothetical protein WT05_03415 [Burkholderia stagnalis]